MGVAEQPPCSRGMQELLALERLRSLMEAQEAQLPAMEVSFNFAVDSRRMEMEARLQSQLATALEPTEPEVRSRSQQELQSAPASPEA